MEDKETRETNLNINWGKCKINVDFTECLLDISKILFFGIFISYLLAFIFTPLDSTDFNAFNRSNLKLHIDNMTGCHYLSTRQGHIIKRVDAKGKHICIGYEAR